MQPTDSDPPAIERDFQPAPNLRDLLASDLASLTLGQLLGMGAVAGRSESRSRIRTAAGWQVQKHRGVSQKSPRP